MTEEKASNKPSTSNILSYIGLVFFTAVVVGYTIDNKEIVDLLGFAFIMICAVTFMLFPIFLSVCFWCILYSYYKIFHSRTIHDTIIVVWSIILPIWWILIPEYNVSCDAWIQERYYESHKEELWEVAHTLEGIRKQTNDYIYIRNDDEDYETGNQNNLKEEGLSKAEFEQVQDILEDNGYQDLLCTDSFCEIGFRYEGLGLYGYRLYLKPTKIEDNYSNIIYNDSVTFTYGGGAIGSDSYPRKDEYLAEKKKQK